MTRQSRFTLAAARADWPRALVMALGLPALLLLAAPAGCSGDVAPAGHDAGADGAVGVDGAVGDAPWDDAEEPPDALAPDARADGMGPDLPGADAPDGAGDDAGADPCAAAAQGCDDGNPCTTDGCVPATGECVHVPVPANTPCEDGDKCTQEDACRPDGTCGGTPTAACDDGDPCTVDACDPETGDCSHAVASEGVACDDGDACTDGDACAADGTCAGTPRGCDDGLGCSLDACDPATGACSHDLSPCHCVSDLGCDDGDPCTSDACDTETGLCVNAPLAGEAAAAVTCDDGDPCTTGDACVDGACAGTPPSCDDQIACTVDSCDPATGECAHDATGCECLADDDCDDGDACTVDSCGTDNTCAHTPDGTVEGEACHTPTTRGACLQGVCRGVAEVAVGDLHACARLATGDIRCWGDKTSGALCVPPGTSEGEGTGLSLLDALDESPSVVSGLGTPAPAEPPALPAMAAGAAFTCALVKGVDAAAVVRCWGDNTWGQLGLAPGGRRDCVTDELSPSVVKLWDAQPLPEVVTTVTAGRDHACAITGEGGARTVRCWGRNDRGQLGTGDTQPLSADQNGLVEPSRVNLGGDVPVAVAAGEVHTCALVEGGDVRCWGGNDHGQLGTGDTLDRAASNGAPASRLHLDDGPAVALASGRAHVCVILASGAVRCWGRNDHGQLGAGSTVDRMDDSGEEPSLLTFGDDLAVELALGSLHTCARTAAGAVYCWGSNGNAQLGGELSPTAYPAVLDKPNEIPPLVDLGAPALHVYAGGEETCALLPDEQVRCWGRNDHGQLGIGSTEQVGGGPFDSELGSMPPERLTNAMGAPGVTCSGGGSTCLSQVCHNNLCAP